MTKSILFGIYTESSLLYITTIFVSLLCLGFGIGIAFYSGIVMLSYYFEQKIALANGIAFSGCTYRWHTYLSTLDTIFK